MTNAHFPPSLQLVEMGYDAVIHDVDMVWTTDPRELWLTDPELGGDVRLSAVPLSKNDIRPLDSNHGCVEPTHG